MFCAPIFKLVPLVFSLREARNGNGAQTIASTLPSVGTLFTVSSTNCSASANVLFIFQFPAITFLRIDFHLFIMIRLCRAAVEIYSLSAGKRQASSALYALAGSCLACSSRRSLAYFHC